jgi:hypothetical protein
LTISERSTPLGRLVTARAKGSGKVVISGPSDSAWLQEILSELPKLGVELTLVDGALSRMSLASPAVTEALILCTGAALSPQLENVIRQTKFRCDLIELPQVENELQQQLQSLENGIWSQHPTTNEWGKIANSVFTFDNDSRHCEAQSAEATEARSASSTKSIQKKTDCFASLAMTTENLAPNSKEIPRFARDDKQKTINL